MDDFDVTPYLRPPAFNAPNGITLGLQLLAVTPASPPDGVKRTAKRLRRAVNAMQEGFAAKARQDDVVELRPFDLRVDAASSALRMRLDGYAMLPVEGYPKAARAAELRDKLFPEGLGFTQIEYRAEWAEIDKRLRLIREEKLERELDALAGPEFLKEIRDAHAAYGEAQGLGRKHREAPAEGPNLLDLLRELVRAVGAYTLQVLAMADPDDETALTAVRAALRPLDDYRASQTRKTASDDQPTPPAPPPANPQPK